MRHPALNAHQQDSKEFFSTGPTAAHLVITADNRRFVVSATSALAAMNQQNLKNEGRVVRVSRLGKSRDEVRVNLKFGDACEPWHRGRMHTL